MNRSARWRDMRINRRATVLTNRFISISWDCIAVRPANTDTPFIGLFRPVRQFPLAMTDISLMNELFNILHLER
jgi:hypothetical protein